MEILVCKDENAWVGAANDWLRSRLKKMPVERIFLPAGETPRPLYRSWEKSGAPFSDNVRLLQVDEVLTSRGPGIFQKFFKECLPSYQKQFDYIQNADQWAQLTLLGLGTNGHVAFHEPGLPPPFFSGCLELNAETTERLKLAPRSRVVTYGLNAFLRSQGILLLVRGEGKRAILNEILKPECQLPAAKLKTHHDLCILTDFEI
jgi:6-phosphogluconolactonase/glucosamine-6-phosphate isomerase/deaminase